MELSGSSIRKFLIFSYISGNRNPEKNPYISANGIPKRTSCILGNGTFQPKLKK